MTDFLFHKVSEQEKEEIKEEAKRIMDSFSKKLEKVKDKIPEPLIEREDFEREEEEGNEQNADFRKRLFENAPNKNSDFILTEKKKW
jgi:Asp-tRNA(Asn)/Glu-tRNA(Gln) amidotransferase C subunit